MDFASLFRRAVRHGDFTVIDAYGHRHRFAGPPGPRSVIRLHSRKLHRQLFTNPWLKVGEAFTDGMLTWARQPPIADRPQRPQQGDPAYQPIQSDRAGVEERRPPLRPRPAPVRTLPGSQPAILLRLLRIPGPAAGRRPARQAPPSPAWSRRLPGRLPATTPSPPPSSPPPGRNSAGSPGSCSPASAATSPWLWRAAPRGPARSSSRTSEPRSPATQPCATSPRRR